MRSQTVEKPLDGFSKIFKHMPPIQDVLRLWGAFRRSTQVFGRTIPANDLNTRMPPQPLRQCFCAPVRKEINGMVTLQVNEQRPIGAPAPEGKIVYSQVFWSGQKCWCRLFGAAQEGIGARRHGELLGET